MIADEAWKAVKEVSTKLVFDGFSYFVIGHIRGSERIAF